MAQEAKTKSCSNGGLNMNALVNNSALEMTSLQIADLVEKRHDNVKRKIETLINSNVIQCPQIEDIKNHQNRNMEIYVFSGEQGKRDSIVVVSQLCPEFTARLVDRWQELEQQNKKYHIDLSNPHALRRALLDYSEQVIELEAKNTGLERTIQTITQTRNGVKFQQACKLLNIKRHVLAKWLKEHGWDRYLNGARSSTYYSEERGYCETKIEEITKVKTNGELGSYTQIEFFILPKGMAILSKHFGAQT